MLPEKLLPVRVFLEQHHEDLEVVDYESQRLDFPNYELTPFDYLEYARSELEDGSVGSRINCVSHIKRAVECELDTLFYLVGLRSPKRNFPAKMEFVRSAGLLSNRSLETFNTVRNRVEHEYQAPEVEDLGLYFDLAESFVLALEGYFFMLKECPGLLFGFHDYTVPHIGIKAEPRMRVSISTAEPAITFEILDQGQTQTISATGKDLPLFAEAFGILMLLIRSTRLVSLSHVVTKLGGCCRDSKPLQPHGG